MKSHAELEETAVDVGELVEPWVVFKLELAPPPLVDNPETVEEKLLLEAVEATVAPSLLCVVLFWLVPFGVALSRLSPLAMLELPELPLDVELLVAPTLMVGEAMGFC